MMKNIAQKILSRYADVRPEETTSSLLMFLYFFLITSSAYIIKPVKISLYLESLTFKKLPHAYLLTALLMGFVVALNSKMLKTMKRNLYISISMGFFIVTLLVFWFLFRIKWPWLSMIYWLWSEIFMITSVTQFWILINDIYNPRQARRLVGFLVSGGLLGGIIGSLLASFLAKTVGTENLLLICPLFLIFCLFIVLYVHRLSQLGKKEEVKVLGEKKEKVGYFKSFQLLRKNRHLVFLSGMMMAAIVVATLIDFQFNYVIEKTLPVKDARTAFLGRFFFILLIFSSLLHILLTGYILKNLGLRIALLITPAILLVGSVSVLFLPMFLWAVLIKGADKGLSHSLSQSVRELLYIPIPPEIKYKAKVFIDMFVNKLAEGFGALFLLLFVVIFHFEPKTISFLTAAFILVWITLNVQITKEYVNIVKRSLKIKWQDADRFIGEKIDVDMTKLVFDTLESKSRSSVLYAMNLFDLVKKEKLSPELKKVISYKSAEMRAKSMDSLLELNGEVLIPETDDSLEDEFLDSQVKEIMSLNVYQELMEEHIEKVVKEESKAEKIPRMEAAKVMGMMEPTPFSIHHLTKLPEDESPEVVRYAAESAGKLKKREFVPFIVQHLSKPATQEVASKALGEYGVKIIGTLKDYLADLEEDVQLRKSIPDILAQVGTQRAADLLALELKKGNKDLRSEIVQAMYKIKSKRPEIHFEEKIVSPEIISKIKESYLVLVEIHELMSDKKREFMAKDLENNLARSIKLIFELLSLIYPHEDMIKAYQNICVGTKKSTDFSLELLDNILKKETMEFLLPLIDDIPLEDKSKKCKKLLKTLEKAELS